MTNYKLKTFATGNIFEDKGWTLSDPSYNKPSLIRAIYEKKELCVGDESQGIYKFANWLPINKTLKNSTSTQTYKSENWPNTLVFQIFI